MSTAQPAPAEQNRRLRVFLCHASEDKQFVRELYRHLREEGFAPWLDESDLLPGQEWREEIPAAVRTSDAVIICLSHKSVSKEGYLQREIREALEVAKEKPEGTIFIIPGRIEEVEIPSRLREWQWANLFSEVGYRLLVTALYRRADDLGLSRNRDLTAISGATEVAPLTFPADVVKLLSQAYSRPKKYLKWLYLTPILLLVIATILIGPRQRSPQLSALDMYKKGDNYFYGQGVARDYGQAQIWYQKAADAGDPDAMNKLGFIYGTGLGVDRDYQLARSWYEKAAKAGNHDAMYNLGVLYYEGDGVKVDYVQALSWYQKAANAGDIEAMNSLGFMYSQGQGVSSNLDLARFWYSKEAAARAAASSEDTKKRLQALPQKRQSKGISFRSPDHGRFTRFFLLYLSVIRCPTPQ